MYIAESTDTPCQETSPHFWFAKQDTQPARVAKRLCYRCTERVECLNSVVAYEQKHGTQAGIYGGLEPHERAVFLDLPAVSATA